MKKFICLALFIVFIATLNFISLDIISEVRMHGNLNKVESYSRQEPKDVESIYCAPFYIFDGLKTTDVKIDGTTCVATMSKTELLKLVFKMDAKLVKINNATKQIFNLYSPRLNKIEPITSGSKTINMQICVEGENIKVGVPSLCGFI